MRNLLLLPLQFSIVSTDTTFKVFSLLLVPKKSESADIEEPKLENEGTNEEEHNVHISPTPADRKSPTGKTSKVDLQAFAFVKYLN